MIKLFVIPALLLTATAFAAGNSRENCIILSDTEQACAINGELNADGSLALITTKQSALVLRQYWKGVNFHVLPESGYNTLRAKLTNEPFYFDAEPFEFRKKDAKKPPATTDATNAPATGGGSGAGSLISISVGDINVGSDPNASCVECHDNPHGKEAPPSKAEESDK